MKRGADIYLYNGGFHHSKIMMVDETFCTVGTANLNSRSLRYDYETNAFIFDKEFTAHLAQNTLHGNFPRYLDSPQSYALEKTTQKIINY